MAETAAGREKSHEHAGRKPRTSADAKDQKGEKFGAFDLLSHSQLVWWPYRSFSEALLRTHNNLTAFMEVNRKLADEMREIIRKEQDLVMQMSEKMLQRASSGNESDGRMAFHPSENMEEIYNSAVSGNRELGKAVADAQIRSIETLRNHARSATRRPPSGEGKRPKAV